MIPSIGVFLFVLFYFADGYKILVYNPRFGASHVSFMGKIADTLADAGHDVVVYQPILEKMVTKNGSSNPTVRFLSSQYEGKGPGLMAKQGQFWGDDTLGKQIFVIFIFLKKRHKYISDECRFKGPKKISL